MKLILILFLILPIPIQTSFRFVDVTAELNKVEDGQKHVRDLDFDYQWVIFLDTGFYETLCKFEYFDTDLNPQMVTNLLENSNRKSIKLKEEYLNIEDVINESERLHSFINPDEFGISEPVPIVGNKALMSIGNHEYEAYYLIEITQPSVVDVVQVGYVHADVIPQSVLDEMNRVEENKVKKKKKKN